jgi:hypothetical protein
VTHVTWKAKDGSKILVSYAVVINEYAKIMGVMDRVDQKKEICAIGCRSLKW